MVDESITSRPIKALKPPTHGSHVHTEERLHQLSSSIRRFGFATPVLIDADGTILASHGRVEAAKALGLSEVPCISIEGMSEVDKHTYLLAQHKLALQAGWDEALLVSELEGLFETEHGPEGSPTSVAAGEPDTRADNLPEDDEGQPVTRSGDLWFLGRHRLLCGDAVEPTAYLRLLGEERAQMVFTNPLCQEDGELTAFLRSVFRQLDAHSDAGAIHFVASDWRHMREVMEAGEAVYGIVSNLIIWVKDVEGKSGFCGSGHELVFAFEKRSTSAPAGLNLGRTTRFSRDVWRHKGVASLHTDTRNEIAVLPTRRPVALVADAIVDSTEPGAIVLDAFCGSGTVLIAAERTGRLARALELDPSQCDRAVRRWQIYTGEDAVLADTGESYEIVKQRRTAAHEDQHGTSSVTG